MGGTILAFRTPPQFTDFCDRLADASHQFEPLKPAHDQSTLLLLGWSLDESQTEAITIASPPLILPNPLRCYIWLQLTLTSISEHAQSQVLPWEAWCESASAAVSETSRVRELASLTSRLSPALSLHPQNEVFNVYCWEGKEAPLLTRARAVQSALRLEWELSAEYNHTRSPRFLSEAINRLATSDHDLVSLSIKGDPPSEETLQQVAKENGLIFELLRHRYNVPNFSLGDSFVEYLHSGTKQPEVYKSLPGSVEPQESEATVEASSMYLSATVLSGGDAATSWPGHIHPLIGSKIPTFGGCVGDPSSTPGSQQVPPSTSTSSFTQFRPSQQVVLSDSPRSVKARRVAPRKNSPPEVMLPRLQVPQLDALGSNSAEASPVADPPDDSSSSSSPSEAYQSPRRPWTASRRPAFKLSLGSLGAPRQEPAPEADPDEQRSALLAVYRSVCSPIIPNRLFVSGECVASDWDALQRHNISDIINLSGDTCPNYFQGRVNYLTFVIEDTRMSNEVVDSLLMPCLRLMYAMLEDGRRVLLHCREGVSRSVTFAVAYLMWRQRLSFQDALARVRAVRPCANPNTGFTYTLLKFGKRLTDAPETKLFRLTLHHANAPILVPLGQALYDPSSRTWNPNRVQLDSRFVYLLRDNYRIFVWHGKEVPRHMHKMLNKIVESFVSDIVVFEQVSEEIINLIRIREGDEPSDLWELLYPGGVPLTARIARNPAFDEEAALMQCGLPHLTIFDMKTWRIQLTARGAQMGAGALVFRPPHAPNPLPSARETRSPRSATHRPYFTLTPKRESVAPLSGRRLPRLSQPPQNLSEFSTTSAEDRSLKRRAATYRDTNDQNASGLLPNVKSPRLADESPGTAKGLIAPPPPLQDVTGPQTQRHTVKRQPSDTVHEPTPAYEPGVAYVFTYPHLDKGEHILDETCLDSTKILIFAIFADTAPDHLSEDSSPAQRSRLFLWEGKHALLDSDEQREEIIDKFCSVHGLKYSAVDVSWEIDEEESSELTEILYLLA